MDNFDPLLAHVKAMCRNFDREFAGALLRPHGTSIKRLIQGSFPIDDIFSAAKDAGRQLVADGRMSSETLKAVSRELLPLETQVLGSNQFFQRMLDSIKEEVGPAPEAGSVRQRSAQAQSKDSD